MGSPPKVFQMCRAISRDGKWFIESPVWEVPAQDKYAAERTAEIIRSAFEAGQRYRTREILKSMDIIVQE